MIVLDFDDGAPPVCVRSVRHETERTDEKMAKHGDCACAHCGDETDHDYTEDEDVGDVSPGVICEECAIGFREMRETAEYYDEMRARKMHAAA
jgi:hypothetical protein